MTLHVCLWRYIIKDNIRNLFLVINQKKIYISTLIYIIIWYYHLIS